jgi:hypothetical protein
MNTHSSVTYSHLHERFLLIFATQLIVINTAYSVEQNYDYDLDNFVRKLSESYVNPSVLQFIELN